MNLAYQESEASGYSKKIGAGVDYLSPTLEKKLLDKSEDPGKYIS